MSKVRSAPDFVIIFATLFLLGIGIVMVYSASAIVAQKAPFNDPYFFAKRQLIFALLGITAMYVTMNIDYWVWKQWAKPGFYASIGLLILVLIVGIEVNGSKSWLGFGAFGIQPGEFAKLGVVAFLARWLSDNQKQIVLFRKGLVPALAIPLVCFALIMLQPDLGTGTVLMGTAVVMIFASGARISHFAALGMVGVAGFIGLILSAPYRIKRITSFLDPWSDPLNTGYQIIQSLYAIGPGDFSDWGSAKADKSICTYRSPTMISSSPSWQKNWALLAELLFCCCFSCCYGGECGQRLRHQICSGAFWHSESSV